MKARFVENETHLPITMQQFQDLANEILLEINKLTAPHAIDADYLAQVLMSAIHALNHEIGFIKKSDLFESCVNRISCHLTYDAVKEIQARLKKDKSEGAEITDDGLEEASHKLDTAPAQANEQIQ